MNDFKEKENHKYDDIINLPHPVFKSHPPMSRLERAAQFSSFAALNGYEACIEEEARLTEAYVPLDDAENQSLNWQMQVLLKHLKEHPEVAVTYFQPDERKSGGQVRTLNGRVKKIDLFHKRIQLEDSSVVQMETILGLESPLFKEAADDFA